MAANTALFPDASHFTIQGSQFTTTQTNNIQSLAVDSALEILHRHQALEATHTSKTAASAPKCKPGTRTKAIKDITSWATDRGADPSSSAESVLWLRGPAGAGKTCIMREVARICRQEGVLAGDYFFSTRVPGLDDEAPFVATIVSHLITVTPALDHPVRETIRSSSTIFKQSLELQVEKLIFNQLASIPPQTPAPRVLVVDGFDECRDPRQRAHLLRILHSLVASPYSFRVVIACRPEYDIRSAFDQPPLKSIAKILYLEAYQVSGEIYEYLSDEFTRIRETHPAKDSIPSEWPGQAMLHALTDKASGIFAYPSTVIKYIDNHRRHPVDLLEHILRPSSTLSSGEPFAELDALYKIILNPPDTDMPLMKRLLHVVMEITQLPTGYKSNSGVEELVQTRGPDSNDPITRLTHQILSPPLLDKFLSLRGGNNGNDSLRPAFANLSL
ncbi:hypothetical protein H1R20_g14652, partial [Candolleomyces eurysporus]